MSRRKTATDARRWWYGHWRKLRIIYRESFKAATDMAIFSTGMVLTDGNIFASESPRDERTIRHVPFGKWLIGWEQPRAGQLWPTTPKPSR